MLKGVRCTLEWERQCIAGYASDQGWWILMRGFLGRSMVQQRFGREGAEFGRGLGFFDAICAFAITLLITNIDFPPAEAWSSIEQLLSHGLGTQFTGFVISFVVIAAFWRHNTSLLSRFNSIDSAAVTINLVTAGLIVLVPFTTRGISDPTLSDYPLPVALYAANVALTILSQTMLLAVGRRRDLVRGPHSPSLARAEWFDALGKVLVFVLLIPVAFLAGPSWGMLTWLLLFIVSPVLGRRVVRAGEAAAEGVEGAAVGESGR